jgi:hypothetical protein
MSFLFQATAPISSSNWTLIMDKIIMKDDFPILEKWHATIIGIFPRPLGSRHSLYRDSTLPMVPPLCPAHAVMEEDPDGAPYWKKRSRNKFKWRKDVKIVFKKSKQIPIIVRSLLWCHMMFTETYGRGSRWRPILKLSVSLSHVGCMMQNIKRGALMHFTYLFQVSWQRVSSDLLTD